MKLYSFQFGNRQGYMTAQESISLPVGEGDHKFPIDAKGLAVGLDKGWIKLNDNGNVVYKHPFAPTREYIDIPIGTFKVEKLTETLPTKVSEETNAFNRCFSGCYYGQND